LMRTSDPPADDISITLPPASIVAAVPVIW
jgi:hypothetical protein